MERKYRNEHILKEVEGYAEEFIKQKVCNKYRDHFFPALINKFDLKVGIEIGTHLGDFAKNILSRSSIEKLYCVDTWQNDFGSDGYCDKNGDLRMEQCKENLKEYIDNGRCELVRGTSMEVCDSLPNDIDFLYIDGNHTLTGVALDLSFYVPKVSVGKKVVCLHDFKNGRNSGIPDYFGKQLDYGVEIASTDFCNYYGYKLNKVGGKIPGAYFVKI